MKIKRKRYGCCFVKKKKYKMKKLIKKERNIFKSKHEIQFKKKKKNLLYN